MHIPCIHTHTVLQSSLNEALRMWSESVKRVIFWHFLIIQKDFGEFYITDNYYTFFPLIAFHQVVEWNFSHLSQTGMEGTKVCWRNYSKIEQFKVGIWMLFSSKWSSLASWGGKPVTRRQRGLKGLNLCFNALSGFIHLSNFVPTFHMR